MPAAVPAQTAVDRSKGGTLAMVKFPENLDLMYVSFEFYDYRTIGKNTPQGQEPGASTDYMRSLYSANRQTVRSAIDASKTAFAQIYLPIPANLQDSFATAWDTPELGAGASLLAESTQFVNDAWAAGQAFTNEDLRNSMMSRGTDEARENLGMVGNVAGRAAMGVAESVLGMSGISIPLGSMFDQASGTTLNNNLTVLFKGPTLKQHRFSWTMTPRSAAETANLKKIIAIFKRAMSPSMWSPSTSAVLRYPSECLVQFICTARQGDTKFLYPIRPVVVTNISTNYAPNSIPSFYGDFEPTTLQFEVALQETSYYTRESFDNEDEYGSDGYDTGDLVRKPIEADNTPDARTPSTTPSSNAAAGAGVQTTPTTQWGNFVIGLPGQ